MSNHVSSPIGDALGGIGEQLLSASVIGIVVILIAVVVIGFAFYLRYRRKFDISVEIMSERIGGHLTTFYDKGAILTDKDGVKFLRLLKLKNVELPTINFGLTLDKTNRGDVLRYYRKSEDEFIPMTAPKINKMTVVKQDGREFPLVQAEFKQVEGDVAWWNVKRKQIHKGLFDTESMLMKLLPFIPQIIGGILTLFILYVLFDSLPQVLNSMKELVVELRSFRNLDEQVTAAVGGFLWMKHRK